MKKEVKNTLVSVGIVTIGAIVALYAYNQWMPKLVNSVKGMGSKVAEPAPETK